ncbi:MAG TPA: flagellar export chaperone FliS [Steroidobacteraceae bacterium]|jgi:flagellar protein FliS|nr:flagellar export chaperone FliS [Steroidobacteraceae bacterium]
MAGYPNSSIAAYRNVAAHSTVLEADPYQLVAMLMDTALERLNIARAAIQRGDKAGKAAALHRSTAIIEELRSSLNHQVGGEISSSLERLYDYMIRRLLAANLQDDIKAIDEVNKLLSEIRGGWGAIPQAARNAKVP